MTDQAEIKNLFQGNFIECTPVGSRRTCDPAPTDTDDDWLILTTLGFASDISQRGFDLDDPHKHYNPANGIFNSWRREEVNLIITTDRQFYKRFVQATHLAKAMNVLNRKDRVILFQFILYGKVPENILAISTHGWGTSK